MSIEALKHALETLEEVQMAITTSQWMNRRIEALRASIEQAEKPVGEIVGLMLCQDIVNFYSVTPYTQERIPVGTKVYISPQCEWQGLTDKFYEQLAEKHVTNCYFDTLTYAKAIEQALKEKNT
jgi:hypothetical protein